MKKIDTAKKTFESIFGNGFYEVIPVKTFKGKKMDAAYYGRMTIYLNTTGFNPADLYHESAHALDELLFKTQTEFIKFFKPFYDELKQMEYFDGFLSQYDVEYHASECFAESIAMAIEHPEWELGNELINAVKTLLMRNTFRALYGGGFV